MTATVTPISRIRVPANFTPYPHQAECLRDTLQAFRAEGARAAIWRHHRQSGKGRAASALVAQEAFRRPGTYAIVSPTFSLCRENFWDAIDPLTGAKYLDVIPPELVRDRNEAEMSLTMATAKAGQVSRIVFRSALDSDKLRGVAYAGVVLDEFATQHGPDALHVVRPALARSGGWLLITSTPKGLNHFHETWKNAEAAGGWYLSLKTIEATQDHDGAPLIPLAHIEQERREGQAEQWLRQEFWCDFATALTGSYYADQLTRCEQEWRITEVPHRLDRPVLVAFDLGVRDLCVAVYVQPHGERLHIIDCDEFTGLALPEILSRVRGKYNIAAKGWYAPHDLGQRESTAMGADGRALTRAEVAEQLGVKFHIVERARSIQENVDAVRRQFPRYWFHRRTTTTLLQMLGQYERQWDARTKTFAAKPLHSQASHYADALATFARGYRDGDERPRPPRPVYLAKAGTVKDFFTHTARWPGRRR